MGKNVVNPEDTFCVAPSFLLQKMNSDPNTVGNPALRQRHAMFPEAPKASSKWMVLCPDQARAQESNSSWWSSTWYHLTARFSRTLGGEWYLPGSPTASRDRPTCSSRFCWNRPIKSINPYGNYILKKCSNNLKQFQISNIYNILSCRDRNKELRFWNRARCVIMDWLTAQPRPRKIAQMAKGAAWLGWI